jgi:hypothetical protein
MSAKNSPGSLPGLWMIAKAIEAAASIEAAALKL